MTYLSYRHFIAIVVTSAIAITGFSAAPARAGQDDVNKALAALAGLAVLGVVIHNVREDDKKSKPRVIDRRYGPDDRFREEVRRGEKPRPLPRRANRKLLPQQCLRSVETREGRMHVFGQRCLERNYRFADSLPRKCEQKFRTDRGKRMGYGARCLSRRGYALARR